MHTLCLKDGLVGIDYDGIRYDMGSKIGILKANIEIALNHPEIKDELAKYIKKLAEQI